MTIPKAVRDQLGIRVGDEVVFRVEGNGAVLIRTPAFLELDGSVLVSAARRGATWKEIVQRTRSERAMRRR